MSAHARHPHRLSDRKFGLLFTAVFVAIEALVYVWGDIVATWPLMVAAAFLAVALAAPGILMPLNRSWEVLARKLTNGTNLALVTIAFLLTVVPIGLAMRLLGRDPLTRRYDPAASSYWLSVTRGTNAETLKDQF